MTGKTKDYIDDGTDRPSVEDPPPASRDDGDEGDDGEIEILEIEGFEEPSRRAGSPPAAAAGTKAAPPGRDVAPEAEVESLRREKEEAQERLLRKHADLENARKRLEREKEEFLRLAGSDLVGKLLPVLDNLERALAVGADAAADTLQEGIRLVYQQFLGILKKEGLEEIEAEGLPFDPTRHEAVLREETADRDPDEVIEVLQKGYFYRDRLLRPSMVKVSVRPAAAAREETEEETGQEPEED